MTTVLEKAYAKVNLGLDIIGRRADGYHELSMVMHSIGLYDELEIQKRADGKRFYDTDSRVLPMDGTNLVCKAADLFCRTYHIEEGFSIMLRKRIPMAAGLAGGSTDAAAALKGLNRLFELNKSQEELAALAAGLGADVPYCVFSKTALAKGVGEKLTMLPSFPECGIFLVKPSVDISTKWAYEKIDQASVYAHPDIEGLVGAIKEQDLDAVCGKMGNSFESVMIPRYPVIGEIKRLMKENGAKAALMSGSGSSVFGIYTDPESMERTEKKIKCVNPEFFYKIW